MGVGWSSDPASLASTITSRPPISLPHVVTSWRYPVLRTQEQKFPFVSRKPNQGSRREEVALEHLFHSPEPQGPSPPPEDVGRPTLDPPTTVQEQGLAKEPILQKNNSERWPECLGASATKVGHHGEKSG